MKHPVLKRFAKLLPVVILVLALLTTAAMATETTFDTENFKGLVLTTSVVNKLVKVAEEKYGQISSQDIETLLDQNRGGMVD